MIIPHRFPTSNSQLPRRRPSPLCPRLRAPQPRRRGAVGGAGAGGQGRGGQDLVELKALEVGKTWKNSWEYGKNIPLELGKPGNMGKFMGNNYGKFMGIDGKTVVNGWENHGKNAIRRMFYGEDFSCGMIGLMNCIRRAAICWGNLGTCCTLLGCHQNIWGF